MSPNQRKSRKRQLIAEYGNVCFWCGCELSEDRSSKNHLTIDHLKPKSLGGSNNLENLRLACFECNHSRGNSNFPPKRILKPCFLN